MLFAKVLRETFSLNSLPPRKKILQISTRISIMISFINVKSTLPIVICYLVQFINQMSVWKYLIDV